MIGTLGPCLPVDLLAASGRLRGPLSWQLDRSTPRADGWLESRFPRWARSILEDWADGRFVEQEVVVLTRGEYVVQRRYNYLCELQRRGIVGGPRPLIFDVAKIPRATSEAHTIAAVRQLAAELGLDDAALGSGIAATNAERAGRTPLATHRGCLLAGTPPPHELLHEAIRGAGFGPIGPTLGDEWADPGPPVATDREPATAIGQQVHARQNAARGFEDTPARAVALAALHGARAAVLWHSEEDEARIWSVPRVRQALAEAGVPTLVMTRRDERARDGAPAEIGAFLKGLEL
jgi:hypothetical protein